MKCTLLIFFAILLSTTAVNGVVDGENFQATTNATSELLDQVNNGYIVKLRPGVQVNSFIAQSRSLVGDNDQIEHTYNAGGFEGFAGKLTEKEVERLQNDERVEYIEPQTIMHTMGQQSNVPSWGLSRISSRRNGNSQIYTYPDSAGEGIDVWVIDTGVDAGHREFGGRAQQVKSFVRGEANADLAGHGTHVAGTIGSNTYGVAKRAKIYGLKVLNRKGSGAISDIVAAVQYVTRAARRGKTVINMSLGGSKSRALDDAVSAAANAGVAVIVAAGNDHANACRESPAGSSRAFAVASSDRNDRQSSFSNYGPCARLYAPGSGIRSLAPNGGTTSMSGTSMSSPHVAGVAALYLSARSYSNVDELYSALVNNATPNVVSGVSQGTPNKLVYNQP
ncbi:peptidase S8 and S53 subtilisin kexin sedolisin [Syncephalis fuscata]|nr:peptidase S8 and S53 subtilisin kexin sedolisin [Syncephalis fuscata]